MAIDWTLTGITTGVATGIIGSATGVISLIWHFTKNRAKVNFEKIDCSLSAYNSINQAELMIITTLRNKGHRPTSINRFIIGINDFELKDNEFWVGPITDDKMPRHLGAGLTEQFNITCRLSLAQLKAIIEKDFVLTVEAEHTFKKIKKVQEFKKLKKPEAINNLSVFKG